MKKLAIVFAVILLAACSTTNKHSPENIAKISLDWSGVYQGVFPCADCEGIDTSLTLNSDDTFKLERTYKQGKLTSMRQGTVGKFTWNPTKPLIYLPEDGAILTFFVGEGYVTAYDIDGNPIDSKLNYTLNKVQNIESNN
ncbi:copper resistance protein NlpE [Orbus wheelerorum]|uniref:copper resistance protein NlpE n=1 Tax=Orbus wheelerorum TaxID=3074111 RepID=UPI00370D4512